VFKSYIYIYIIFYFFIVVIIVVSTIKSNSAGLDISLEGTYKF